MVDDPPKAFLGFEAIMQAFGNAHCPRIVECADQHDGTFSQLHKASLGGRKHAKSAMMRCERHNGVGQRDHIRHIHPAREAELGLKLLLRRGVVIGFTETVSCRIGAGGDRLPKQVDIRDALGQAIAANSKAKHSCQHQRRGRQNPPASPGARRYRRIFWARRSGMEREARRNCVQALGFRFKYFPLRELGILVGCVHPLRIRMTKCRHIGAGRQLNDGLARMGRVVIILDQALAHLGGGRANYRIGIGVVIGLPPESLDADRPLFEAGGIAEEGLLDRIGQEHRVAFAVGE